jgi:predicted transcriptional regulator
MRTVKEMLSSKYKHSNNTIDPKEMVIDALKKLDSVNLSYLVVVEDGMFKGIFSERDYTRNLILKGRSSRDTRVEEVMSTNLPVVALSKSVEDCMYLMNTRGSRYLFAFDEDEFYGVVTIHDILREVIANKEEVFDYTLTTNLLDQDESGKIF